jgi:hypothetical protein
MLERNASLPPDRRMQYRIGINQGDVLFDEDRIFGEGINIAARLEEICEPGGICISGKVFEEIKGRFEIAYEDIGEQTLKNILAPVRAYRIGLSGASCSKPQAQRASAWLRRNTLRLVGAGVLISLIGFGVAWWSLPESLRMPQRNQVASRAPTSPPLVAPLATPSLAIAPPAEHEAKLSAALADPRAATDAVPAQPATPATPAPAESAAAATSPSAATAGPQSFDGVWEFVLTGGEYCPIKTMTFRMLFRDGDISPGMGKTIGRVNADGGFRFANPSPTNPGITVQSQGKVAGNKGTGTYQGSGTPCRGTYKIRMVERF